MEDLDWCGVTLKCWSRTGVVISSQRSSTQQLRTHHSSTPVNVHAYAGATPVTATAWVPTTSVSVETVHHHKFWYRTPDGQEHSIDASRARVDLREGQTVTILHVGRAGSSMGHATSVVNHTTNFYNPIVLMADLSRWMKLPLGLINRRIPELIGGSVLALFLSSLWARETRAGIGVSRLEALTCFCVIGFVLYKRAQAYRNAVLTAWVGRCSQAAFRLK